MTQRLDRSGGVEETTARAVRLADELGQTLAEYAMILVLLVILVIAAVAFFGGDLENLFSSIGSGVRDVIP